MPPSMWTGRSLKVGTCLLALVVLAGCGASGPGGTGASKPATTGGAATVSPATGTPATVKLAIAFDSLVNTPVYVAESHGFFKSAGANAQLVYFSGMSPAVTALNAGDVGFVVTSAVNILQAVSRGVKLMPVVSFSDRPAIDMTIDTSLVQRAGVTPTSPLKSRLAVLKGLTLSIDSVGGVGDTMLLSLIKQAGLTVGKDVHLVPIGSGPTQVVAMQHGEVQGFVAPPPFPEETEAGGYGTVLISGLNGDVPSWNNFEWEVVATTPQYAAAHPGAVRAVARAVAQGDALVAQHPDVVIPEMQRRFKKLPPALVGSLLKAIARAVPPNGKMSATAWQTAERFMLASGALKKPVNTRSGGFWTNRFLGSR